MYAIEIYVNTCATYIGRLIKLNNELLRILQDEPIKFHIDELYLAYNISYYF